MFRYASSLFSVESDVKFNARIKIYPNGMQEILCASRAIFCEPGWELCGADAPHKRNSNCKNSEKSASAENLERSRRRAAARIRDIALCNRFSYFVTLTLSAAEVDRYDLDGILSRMRIWLDNRVRRNGLKYILVPEFHKDGAIHFHGFFNDVLEFTDSGTLKSPHRKKPFKPRSRAERDREISDGAVVVYNILDWNFGFSTAIPLYGDYNAAISYCCKYVGKCDKKIGGRWYYSGGNFAQPILRFSNLDFNSLVFDGAYTFYIDAVRLSFCLLRIGGNG